METRSAPPSIGGRYRIDGLLGEGGMARVFDAFDERLERPVAVKILRSETLAVPGMRQRFQQEALIAARLIHPHIVAVLDFGETAASSYLVMERLPGSTLRDEIIARGPLPPQRVLLVVSETLAALAAAHAFGVLHRDIKPSNILLERDGHTKITDFGIAKSFDIRLDPEPLQDDLTMTGIVLGTPGYLAPERRAGSPATVQSDLYSVGAVMVETLTGQRLGPEGASTERLPPRLRDVARRALAVDPRERFTSASEMLTSLRRSAAGTEGTPRSTRSSPSPTATMPARVPPPDGAAGTAPRPRTPRGPRVRARRRRVFLAAIGALALVVTLVVLLEQASEPTGPAASASKQSVHLQAAGPADTERSAITALAASLADGGLPGDAALARALETAAAQPPGSPRLGAAQQVLALAQVLVDGGGITTGQYQDVVNVLQPTGASVTTPTVTTTTSTVPSPSLQGPYFQGRGHGHDGGAGNGDEG